MTAGGRRWRRRLATVRADTFAGRPKISSPLLCSGIIAAGAIGFADYFEPQSSRSKEERLRDKAESSFADFLGVPGEAQYRVAAPFVG